MSGVAQLGDPAPGAMVTPSIRLVRLLGRGGMGSVWIASHLTLHTEVVVKFMAAEYALNQEAMLRFEREATLAAQAKSPHVVQVFDHGVSQLGLPYIAMELLEGEDLASRLNREGAIRPDLFGNWLAQACRGLSRAHGKGIVHRDIKPENIFLCENDGEILVKVLDFGIAKGESGPMAFSGTRTGAFLGTAYYMSPEQTMGAKDLDARADLWALGVVAYLALTGVRPFDADAIGPLVMAITSAPIAPPSSHNRALSPAIDAWMATALARDRNQRFQSAKQMAEAFALAASAPSPQVSSAPPLAAAPILVGAPAGGIGSATGAAPARTAPTGAIGLSTMAPSVRPGASTNGGVEPQVVKTSKTGPWLVLGGLAIAAVVGGAFAVTRLGATASAEAIVSASASALPAPAAAPPAPPVVVATEPAAPAPTPEPSAAPAVSSAATPTPVPAIGRVPVAPKPGGAAAAAPAAAAPASPPATPAAAPVKPAEATQAPASAARPAAKPAETRNPLQMKIE